ncbi:MAG: hypothetical protein QG625_2236 [Cyanobacteriota bacterium erpe_2018_sw_39hr_WHONDRS-SW48-000098_B_bin.30]|nr:hypothetical protein [Candidatus Obscuribacter sp.]MDQ5966081.1 hypothetical protein [Cyanobacteriota bacterium erpe_2018_sw_39hr_WHONDRS-SW48-000098_B_bin.30]
MSVNLIAVKNASSLVSTNTQKAFKDDLENAFQNHLKQLSALTAATRDSKDKLKADYHTAQLETGKLSKFQRESAFDKRKHALQRLIPLAAEATDAEVYTMVDQLTAIQCEYDADIKSAVNSYIAEIDQLQWVFAEKLEGIYKALQLAQVELKKDYAKEKKRIKREFRSRLNKRNGIWVKALFGNAEALAEMTALAASTRR